MFTLPDNILQFLRPFYIIFSTQKTFTKMLVLFTGAIFCHGGRTVCSCLKAIGMHGEKAFSNYHHVLNRCKWNSLKGTKKILELIPTSSEIILVVDEHLERRKGKKIKAKGTHRDAVASSNSWLVKCTGIKWTVLSCLITFSWSKRPLALPFFCVPIFPVDHPIYKRRKHRTGIDIICQMLCCVKRWFPEKTILLIGDGDYARVKLAQVCIRLEIALLTRLRKDARVHDYPESSKKRGRNRKRGKRLSKSDITSRSEKVSWYGVMTKKITGKVKKCIWYSGKPEVYLPVFAGWIELKKNDELTLRSST